MSDVPEPRIADVDRDRASQHLRVAFGEGRITEGELEERLTTVFQALTARELDVVLADLPSPPAAAVGAVVKPDRSTFDPRPGLPFLLAPVICTLIYLMTNAGGYFWPMWVWLGCGIPAVIAIVASGPIGDESDGPAEPPPAPPGLSS